MIPTDRPSALMTGRASTRYKVIKAAASNTVRPGALESLGPARGLTQWSMSPDAQGWWGCPRAQCDGQAPKGNCRAGFGKEQIICPCDRHCLPSDHLYRQDPFQGARHSVRHRWHRVPAPGRRCGHRNQPHQLSRFRPRVSRLIAPATGWCASWRRMAFSSIQSPGP